MVTLDGFQAHKTADCQPLLVVLPAIDHSVNMLGEDLSCLHEDRVVLLPHLPIDGKRSLDRGRRDDFFNFNRIHGRPPDANAPARRLGPISQFVNSELVPRPDVRFRTVSKIEQRVAVGCGRLQGKPQASVVSLQDPDGLSAPPPRWGRLSPSLEAEVEPVENPIDETTTVAAMLRRPAVSGEPQVFGAAPFRMAMGPERIYGTFNLTRQYEADELIKRITAMKAFLKPE